MKNNKFFFFFCIFIIAAYFIYGLFFLNIPFVRPDELWEISRAHFLLKHHHQGDPMFPREISPYMATLFNATYGSQFLGLLRTASQAFFIAVIPLDDLFALRLTSFAWSILLCLLTGLLAIKLGINKSAAFLSIVLLIITPEFFTQLHSERPELMVATAYLFGLLLFNHVLEEKIHLRKIFLLFFSGIYAWLAVILIHANAIVIPATFCFLYFMKESKNFFSLNSVMLGISTAAGLFYFYYLIQAPLAGSLSEGGGNLLEAQGPPVARIGIKSVILMPLIFYNKFSAFNGFARPVSLFFFIAACVSFFLLFKKKKNSLHAAQANIIIPGIVVPLIVLILFSGSNGHYNIIVFPLCAMIIAMFINEFLLIEKTKIKFIPFLICLLFLMFASNFYGVTRQITYTKEYFRIINEARKIIGDNKSTIIANNFYYLKFKDQPFYSSSAIGKVIGKPDQSFEQAAYAVHANYLIIDDGLVHRFYSQRGKTWTDNMFEFIDKNTKLIGEIKADCFIGNLVGPPSAFPPQWRYEGQKENFIGKIKIYKINS